MAAVYSVKHAAAMTGIPADTLRMWERRYRVVAPIRSEGGYRLYDDAAIARLSAMRALVAAGWSPRLAAEQVRSGTTAGPIAEAPPAGAASAVVEGEPVGDVDALVAIAQEFDVGALQRLLAQMFGRDDFEHVADNWLMPTLLVLGNAWHSGVVTVAGEHFVSAAVQRRLAAAFDAAPANAGAPRWSSASPVAPGTSSACWPSRWPCAGPGWRSSTSAATCPRRPGSSRRAARRPPAVIGVPASDDIPAVRDTVAALAAARPGLPVFLGGGHQEAVGGTAEPLGHRIGAAASEVARRWAPYRIPRPSVGACGSPSSATPASGSSTTATRSSSTRGASPSPRRSTAPTRC